MMIQWYVPCIWLWGLEAHIFSQFSFFCYSHVDSSSQFYSLCSCTLFLQWGYDCEKARRATAVTAQWHVYIGTCWSTLQTNLPVSHKSPFVVCIREKQVFLGACVLRRDEKLGFGRNENQIHQKIEYKGALRWNLSQNIYQKFAEYFLKIWEISFSILELWAG